MKIEFIEKEQDWQNETTRYWFIVDRVKYCIADQNGDLSLLDSCGYPLEGWSEYERIIGALNPHYQDHIMDGV